jgi:hypothetical protein
MVFEPDELQERIRALGDDELLRMVHEEADQYRPEAIAIARDEIANRGLTDDEATDDEDIDPAAADEEEADEALGSQQGLLCAACGSGLRPALLVGESQVVAIFEDNREQRFVRAMVCPHCGTADLFVDFATDVEG